MNSLIPDTWLKRLPVIDTHVHTSMGPERFDPVRVEEQLSRTMEAGRDHGVGMWISLGGFNLYDPASNVRKVNAMTANLQGKYPDHFRGLAFVNPLLGERRVKEELDIALGEEKLIGIKCELECNCRDPLFRTVVDRAIAYGVPLLQHTWNHTGTSRKQGENSSTDVAWLATEYKELRIVMAHLTGIQVRGLYDVADCPNVIVDTSGNPPLRNYVEEAIRILGDNRLMYGSDIPIRGYHSQLGRILGADLSDGVKENILWKNARSFYGEALP